MKTNNADISGALQHANVRCHQHGDPHLVAVARTTALGYSKAAIHKGARTRHSRRAINTQATLYSNTPPAAVSAVCTWDAKIFLLYRGYNTNTKGVIYAGGTIGISGVVGGDVTLYTPNTWSFSTTYGYANDPAKGLCIDILGTISGQNTYGRQQRQHAAGHQYGGALLIGLDDTPDLNLNAVIMALGTSFTVENYNSGPTNALTCGTSTDGHGCLYLTGGLIQNNRGPVGLTSGQGYVKRYSYDRCAGLNPPPYFPTTGRFFDNRYYD